MGDSAPFSMQDNLPPSDFTTSSDAEPCPLVIVQGFFATTGPLLWGDFEDHINGSPDSARDEKGGMRKRRKALFVGVGPVSSLHDRACELYYALKGGVVDYGEQHSVTYSHRRYGRDRGAGSYPQWSRERPLHFLGHSIGGTTIVKLHDMIKEGCFPNAHPDMILSITSISAPHRGTQLIYTLGERTDIAPAVRPLSFGSALSKIVHVLSFVAPLLPLWLDLHAESRDLSFHDMSISNLVKQLWKSDWAESRDATPFDVTFRAADERELCGEGRTNARTWYRSIATCWTQSSSDGQVHPPPLSSGLIQPPLYICSSRIASFDFSILRPIPSFIDEPPPHAKDIESGSSFPCTGSLNKTLGSEFRANDGVVPLFSQWHPLTCSPGHCLHEEPSSSLSQAVCDNRLLLLRDPAPGLWHAQTVNQASHFSFACVWSSMREHRKFWNNVGDWLEAVETCWQKASH